MQTSFTVDPAIGLAGQIQDAGESSVKSFLAETDILPGRLVEVNPATGAIRYPASTALGRVAGIACFMSFAPPGGWKAGQQVPVLRQGRIFVEFSGGTQAPLLAANVNHSSTIATNRGKLSASATSVVAGSEVSAVGPAVFVKDTGSAALAIVEVNFP